VRVSAITYQLITITQKATHNVYAQGELEYILSSNGGTEQITINYINSGSFTPNSIISLVFEIEGSVTGLSASGFNSLPNPVVNTTNNTVTISGGVGTWNTISQRLATITYFPPALATGCVSVENTDSGLFLRNSPFGFFSVPVKRSNYKCSASGVVALAAGDDLLQPRRVELFSTSGSGEAFPFGNDPSPYTVSGVEISGQDVQVSVDPFRFNRQKYNDNIDVLDMSLIQNHILGINTFPNKFQFVASDVTLDSYIDVSDLVSISRVILNLNPNNMAQAWVYPTLNSLNIVSDPVSYNTTFDFNDIQTLTSLNFTAVKLGDARVDNDDYDKSKIETKFVHLGDASVRAGQTVDVPVFIPNLTDVKLLSMAFSGSEPDLEIVSIEPGSIKTNDNFNFSTNSETGAMNLIWINMQDETRSKASAPSFHIRVRAKRDLKNLSNSIKLTSDYVDNNIFEFSKSKSKFSPFSEIALNWRSEGSEISPSNFSVNVASENPFRTNLFLTIESPSSQSVEAKVFNNE